MNQLSRVVSNRIRLSLVLAVLTALAACETVPERDYAAYNEYMPRSILVLPPTNSSVDVNASYSYVTTTSQPVAERGYYVFPIALVDVLMKENGMPFPEDMHAIPLEKLGEVFGADAVMYINLLDFGQKYQIVESVSVVNAEARLVDIGTGVELWRDSIKYSRGSSSNQGGLLGALVEAAISQAAADIRDDTHSAARVANNRLVQSMLIGPLHSDFDPGVAPSPEPEP